MRRLRTGLRILLVPGLATCGALLGWLADGSLVASLVLLVEPVLWVAACWLAYAALLRHDTALALRISFGAIAAVAAARIARPPAEAAGVDAAPFADRTRACARGLALPTGTVRVLQWTLSSDHDGVVAAVTEAAPDIAVIRGALGSSELVALGAAVGGEALSLGRDPPVHLFSRGSFDRCGEADSWHDSPAPGAELGLVFASLGAASLPLVTVTLPEVGSVADWETSMRTGRAALRSTLDSLGSSLLLVSIAAPLPLAGPRLAATLRSTQLLPASRAPNWPAWPLPLHTCDQLWVAEAWRGAPVTLVRADGPTRAGALVELAPRWPVILPATGDDNSVR
ncbi:MAG: hypothetical protein EXR71_00130 [Myxococcales bacterium]|nr:hypothetical protein [Myxococcales bacterium]